MSSDKEDWEKFRQLGVFMTVPFVLAVPPILGWYIGNWLDGIFDTAPILQFVMLFLGVLAGFREFYRIVKRFGDGS